MPPSPQPESPAFRPSLRRSSSLPPEILKPSRISPPPSPPEQKRVQEPGSQFLEDWVEVEELSPEAIIPDSVTVIKDPEVEMPEDEELDAEQELERTFTNIKLDRMHDWSLSEGSSDDGRDTSQAARKRKFTPTGDEETEDKRKRRIASPRTSSPLWKT